jgi:hypothetical protein
VIYLGIDDTDTLETAGTNQLARLIVERLADRLRCVSIVRHQLFFDPRVPYTSKNGSASIRFKRITPMPLSDVISAVRHVMQEWYVEGSDPGLVATEQIPDELTDYALRCKCELIEQREPRELAAKHGIHLEGLGGTEGGVIGALAAVGLIATENDGRVVKWQTWPDDLTGPTSIDVLHERRVSVRRFDQGTAVSEGLVDLGKKLRPNLVERSCVLWVEPACEPSSCSWTALKIH